MAQADAMDLSANQQLFEVRFKPKSEMLDQRGAWAQQLSDALGLPLWRVSENRVDLHVVGESKTAFLTFRNFGGMVLDGRRRDHFSEFAALVVRSVFGLDGFGKALVVDRVGARSRFIDAFPDSFEELRSRCASRYAVVTDAALKAVGASAQISDVGYNLNFVDGSEQCYTTLGPMRAAQVDKFFKKEAQFPAVGLFHDIDCFQTSLGPVTADALAKSVATLAESGWERHERVKSLLFRG
jgi:hypothetical protein